VGCHADSSWVIALINPEDRHHGDAVAQVETLVGAPSLSAFALSEVLCGVKNRRRAKYKQLTEVFTPIVPIDDVIAMKAAEIRVEERISLGDSIIIASALIHDTELLTFDKKMQSVFERLR
jgi:predicted nucleic acid-binding protein